MGSVASAAGPVLHLSQVAGGALLDDAGGRLGRVADLIVRLDHAEHPPLTGFLVSVAGRDAFLAVERVAELRAGAVVLRRAELDLRPFARRPEEVLLKADVLDRQLINVDGARLVRANEIELADIDGCWRVVGVDTGPRGALRRLLPRALGRRVAPGGFLDWAVVEPFVGHVPTVRLRIAHPRLARLHPAQIADLVEAGSHGEGAEIIRAVGAGDEQLEADVFEELDEQHQQEFLRVRPDPEIAAVLARMAPDDAADVVADLDDARRETVLGLLPAGERARIRTLLGFDPGRAGGLMSTDFVQVDPQATAGEALDRVRHGDVAGDLLTCVFVHDARRRLQGAVSLAALLRAPADTPVAQLVGAAAPRLRADAGLEEVAGVMADFDLTAVAVVDEADRMIGVITVDDVLETMLPKGWRRRFGLFGDQ